jgi:hypothetical protein
MSSQIGRRVQGFGLDWRRVDGSSIFNFGNSGDFGNLSYDPLPASFSQDPTPHSAFVANKRRSAIRPNGDRTVEALFSRISHAQLRIFRLAHYSVFKDHPPGTLPPKANVVLYLLFAIMSSKNRRNRSPERTCPKNDFSCERLGICAIRVFSCAQSNSQIIGGRTYCLIDKFTLRKL